MADKREAQPILESVEEKKIPVFTVLKNGAILKNIFLLDNPPSSSSSSSNQETAEFEEILVVGRHPDCNITLEHPSISRFHLRIHSKPSSLSLSVTDLSSGILPLNFFSKVCLFFYKLFMGFSSFLSLS